MAILNHHDLNVNNPLYICIIYIYIYIYMIPKPILTDIQCNSGSLSFTFSNSETINGTY